MEKISRIIDRPSALAQDRTHVGHNQGYQISVGIPLFNSKPFLDNIRANCKVLAEQESIEIIISDQHCLDDTLVQLQSEWGHDRRFKFFRSTDSIDWVAHMNLLLSVAKGKYFRWMPHDDLFPAGSLEILTERLDHDPNVLLAYAPTRGIDFYGNRLPDRDRINTSPLQRGEKWQFRYSLDLFPKCYCDGAFKGLFRRQPVVDAALYIRPTYELVGAERAWLFGMSLLGGLGEESESIYLKRYHERSTHAQWNVTNRHKLSITKTMMSYLIDHGDNAFATLHGMTSLWVTTLRSIYTEYTTKNQK